MKFRFETKPPIVNNRRKYKNTQEWRIAGNIRSAEWHRKSQCLLGPDCGCGDCKKETEFNNSGGADRW